MSSAGATLCAARDEQELLPSCLDGSRPPPCPAESIMIYLTSPGLSVMPMRVMASDSIASVKLRIQTCKGFVVKKQKLVFDGRELARNDCRIRDYGVSDGNVLHLVIRTSDLRLITVKTVHGKKFRFHVEPGRTVGYVKQQIARNRLGPARPEQRLVFEGEELDDRHMIHDICRSNDAVIHLLVQRSAKVRTKPVERDFELSIVAHNAGEMDQSEELMCDGEPLERHFGIEPVIVNPKAELPSVLRDLIGAVFAGLENGNTPIMSSEGTGGAYFMQDALGQDYIAVFKPVDEEPMATNNPRGLPVSSTGEELKKGTWVSEGAFREVAAYLLDHPSGGHQSFAGDVVGFAGVPPTALVWCLHRDFRKPEGNEPMFKLGSLQAFVKNQGSCEDMGPSAFPVQEVHKICVLDIRLGDADRHAGNILVCKEDDSRGLWLVPIDHGYCLPESFEDCTFEWLYWPQSHEPFSDETVEYIRYLDPEEDIGILKFHGWELSTQCARTLRITTMLLKKGVERGLTAYDIGSILCRETVKEESKIEEIICKAGDGVLPGASEAAFLESISEIMDRHLDEISKQSK